MEPLNKSCMDATASRRWLWLLLAVAVIWFGNIEYRKLIKPDEGRYAEIPREMAASGDWVTPRLNDLKYFEKPPLQYWATAAAYTVFGEHQWTSRLWTALTGFAGILLGFSVADVSLDFNFSVFSIRYFEKELISFFNQ